jgi:hypothetical protein
LPQDGEHAAPRVAPPGEAAANAVENSVSAANDLGNVPERLHKLIDRDTWDVYYMQKARIGYGYTRWRAVPNKPDLISAEGLLRLAVKRGGEESVSEVRMSVVETAAGEVRSFRSEMRLGEIPNVVRGRVADGAMQIAVESGGQSRTSTLPWKDNPGGYFAVEEELFCRPMQPGERRTVRALAPVFNQVGEVELRAVDFQETDLLVGRRGLLRIETTTRLPGTPPIEGTLWTDRAGETLKSETAALGQVVYRTTKDVALGEASGPSLDLFDTSTVRLARPIPDAHHARRLRYRVSLDNADPTGVFVSDLSQQVTAIDPRTAEILVRAVRPDDPPASTPISDRASLPGDDERQANSFIESDDPRVATMAHDAAGRELDGWPLAVALERYVHDKVATKNYSQTFASAAEVARKLEGDCTEHAVLLAALLRARGLPARVAIGLVYVPAAQAFGFHMWTEVFVSDHWIGLDGTLGHGGIGAGHLKLATSNLKDATALASFLPVAQVLGKLKIEVLGDE